MLDKETVFLKKTRKKTILLLKNKVRLQRVVHVKH